MVPTHQAEIWLLGKKDIKDDWESLEGVGPDQAFKYKMSTGESYSHENGIGVCVPLTFFEALTVF